VCELGDRIQDLLLGRPFHLDMHQYIGNKYQVNMAIGQSREHASALEVNQVLSAGLRQRISGGLVAA